MGIKQTGATPAPPPGALGGGLVVAACGTALLLAPKRGRWAGLKEPCMSPYMSPCMSCMVACSRHQVWEVCFPVCARLPYTGSLRTDASSRYCPLRPQRLGLKRLSLKRLGLERLGLKRCCSLQAKTVEGNAHSAPRCSLARSRVSPVTRGWWDLVTRNRAGEMCKKELARLRRKESMESGFGVSRRYFLKVSAALHPKLVPARSASSAWCARRRRSAEAGRATTTTTFQRTCRY